MPETNTVAPSGLTAPARQHAPRSKLAHSCRPDVVCGLVTTAVLGLADDTPADDGTRPAAGEQDAQHQARHSTTNASPATHRRVGLFPPRCQLFKDFGVFRMGRQVLSGVAMKASLSSRIRLPELPAGACCGIGVDCYPLATPVMSKHQDRRASWNRVSDARWLRHAADEPVRCACSGPQYQGVMWPVLTALKELDGSATVWK